ncbi:glycoside hydrolase domain-containing protein [Christiangramia fulva]|uniref:glycoside hydrolase domain-containing protein n=1 Tax=Christiangramia fulva TaxID=2126553 RepID=UPI001F1CF2DD|nr:glycoside hydrolase domain-containing protein [Christiangramia fulva]
MKNTLFGLLILLYVSAFSQHTYPPQQYKWNADSLGTQRAVLKVLSDDDTVSATIPWRNRNVSNEQQLIIVDSLSNHRFYPTQYNEMNALSGTFRFHPNSGKGIYYVYFLPYELHGSKNYPNAVYLTREVPLQTSALKKGANTKFLRIESVNEFNNSSEMEIIASPNEITEFLNKTGKQPYYVFPETFRQPIIMKNRLPKKWMIKKGASEILRDRVSRGAFYAFQLGIWSADHNLDQVEVSVSDLKSETGDVISRNNFTCFNTEGVDYRGNPMRQEVNIPKGIIQPLWCGFEIKKDLAPGTYTGIATVTVGQKNKKEIKLQFDVREDIAKNLSFDEPWKMTRLPWLNSRLAEGNTVIAPYEPLKITGNEIQLLGRKVILDSSGLPKRILTYFNSRMTRILDRPSDILAKPIQFQIKNSRDEFLHFKASSLKFTQKEDGKVSWKTTLTFSKMELEILGSIEFDGFMDYKVKVIAKEPVSLNDIAMEIPVAKNKFRYFMGLGKKGGNAPDSLKWKWDVTHKNQDGGWFGGVNGGIQFSLRDQHYMRPLNTNFYLKKPLLLPTSWGNDNKGGINIDSKDDMVTVNCYSGTRDLKKGDSLYYNFHLLITPFHTLNTSQQWDMRFYHAYKPIDTVVASGATVVNIHHGNEINPYINYPFIATKEMKDYVDEAHQKGIKVKIYNTIREVSNRLYELYPIRSLGHEVFSSGEGGGYSWLQEHLNDDYIAAWYVPQFHDAAIINSGMNRWHNYYVEGMNWLVDNIDIDGIYLDDVAFDRITMKRIKRVLTKNGHPGIIDLHSANQYNERDGFNNSANLYLEHFPYLNRLWFGEYFDYENNGPDFMLTEVSGIPFGLMGEMLQDGGNLYRGMLYGMTNRMPWSANADPRPIWKLWDEFEIQGSEMIGYWAEDCPVKTDNDQVLVTVYKKGKKVLISMASWYPEQTEVSLQINWKLLGIKPK